MIQITSTSYQLGVRTRLDSSFFADSTSCVDIYSQIAMWTHSSTHFQQSAKDEFLATDLADPWLIAYAKKNDLTIVTHEISQPQRRNRIKSLNHVYILS